MAAETRQAIRDMRDLKRSTVSVDSSELNESVTISLGRSRGTAAPKCNTRAKFAGVVYIIRVALMATS
jgi:hypothetical protein